jgi:septal ring factor EnvC (AmiA/AmiB activator)
MSKRVLDVYDVRDYVKSLPLSYELRYTVKRRRLDLADVKADLEEVEADLQRADQEAQEISDLIDNCEKDHDREAELEAKLKELREKSKECEERIRAFKLAHEKLNTERSAISELLRS